MNLQEQMKRVQELTQHTYTRAELKQIYNLVNEVRANIGQPKWAIEDKTERDQLQDIIVLYAAAQYFKED